MPRTTPVFHTAHYNKIAARFGKRKAQIGLNKDAQKVLDDTIVMFIMMFQDDNELFDEQIFLQFLQDKMNEEFDVRAINA